MFFSASTLEHWHRQSVHLQQTVGDRHERASRAEEYRELVSEERAWNLQLAHEMASLVRGNLAGNTYAALVADEQGDRGTILISSRVIARLSCDEECEQVMESLCEQGDEHEVTEEAMACHSKPTVQERLDGELVY